MEQYVGGFLFFNFGELIVTPVLKTMIKLKEVIHCSANIWIIEETDKQHKKRSKLKRHTNKSRWHGSIICLFFFEYIMFRIVRHMGSNRDDKLRYKRDNPGLVCGLF